MKLTPTFDRWRVVVLPFPFVERAVAKRRPALVLSAREFAPSGYVIVAMITSSRRESWPGDTDILDLGSAELPVASLVRLKVFSVDARTVLRPLGTLSSHDRDRVQASLRRYLV
jgi:mRNA interferase MazF